MHNRTIFIGDVHGCLDELQELLHLIAFDPILDRCIIVGDLVDRGPHSANTVKWCRGNNIESVLGNHDEKYVRFHIHQKKFQETGKPVPMSLSPAKLSIYNDLVESGMISWLSDLPTYIEIPEMNLVVVHAGVLPHDTSRARLHTRRAHMYARFIDPSTNKMLALDVEHQQPPGSVHWTELYKGPENVIYGHHAHSFTEPHVTVHESNVRTIGIDTGCCFGGSLTALVLEGNSPNFETKFVQVPAKKLYHSLR